MILEGKPVAEKVLAGVRAGVERVRAERGVTPTLGVVLVGDFAPSQIYVRNKKRAADSVGIARGDAHGVRSTSGTRSVRPTPWASPRAIASIPRG